MNPKAASLQQEASFPRVWQWPLDLTQYDRNAQLTHEELQALAFLKQKETSYKIWHAHCRTLPPLQRLWRPIEDVLNYTQGHLAERRETARIFIQEMATRQTSFWAWTPEDWRAILCPSHAAFCQAHSPFHQCRQQLFTLSYLFCGFLDLDLLSRHELYPFVLKVFGKATVEATIEQVVAGPRQWGYGRWVVHRLGVILQEALLVNRTPYAKDLTKKTLEHIRERVTTSHQRECWHILARALAGLQLLPDPSLLPPRDRGAQQETSRFASCYGIADTWIRACDEWLTTSTLQSSSRKGHHRILLKVGYWLAQTYPEVTSPEQWDRELAAQYVAAVDRLTIGQWVHPESPARKTIKNQIGKPLTARGKVDYLAAMRAFFQDLQEWGKIPRRFDPHRCFGTPRSIRALIAPNPRVISDDLWGKLLWAGLNLTEKDLPRGEYAIPATGFRGEKELVRESWYPLEMIRAMTIAWLFCGVRSNELRRLRVGCIRWQRNDVVIAETADILPKDAVCLLDIPTHKTGPAFTKPVDRVVGEAILLWERLRPSQPPALDPKTGEMVHYLFCFRSKCVGEDYVNRTIVQMLCKKAGIPHQDARGNITSHRARSTIASQLFNAHEPMTLFELQAWLGHRSPISTQHYAKISPTKLAKAYTDADYYQRNLRMITVLIDQDAIRSGATVTGTPWRFYDLGHGLCTYDFFDTCPHRLACAKCSFYVPKGSSLEQIIEGKANLLRMKQELVLTDEESAAVDDGLIALEALQKKLVDVPTPAGLTPRELEEHRQHETPLIPLKTIQRNTGHI